MKSKPNSKESITGPMLKDLMDRQKIESKSKLKEVTVGSDPLPAPDLYQDAGSGYNPDFTFPQA